MNVITPTATKTTSATTQIMIAVISKVTPVFVLPLLAPTTVLAPISSEAHFIIIIVKHAKISDNILYFLTLIETHTADYLIRYAALCKRGFDRS